MNSKMKIEEHKITVREVFDGYYNKYGKTVAENCQMLCADCNRRKSDV